MPASGPAQYDVTVIMCPVWDVGWPWPAPAYICESLRRKGYRVQFLDLNVSMYRTYKSIGMGRLWEDDAYYNPWFFGKLSYLSDLVDLDQIKGSVVAFSTTAFNLHFSISLARRIRDRYPTRKIIFGGHAVHLLFEAWMVPPEVADTICKGEGEQTILEVLERDFRRLDDVPGLYLPSGKRWRLTSERPLIEDLDSVAYPTYAEISLEKYLNPFLPVMGSRGCTGRCIFCSDRYRVPGFRSRSAKNQVDELEYLSANFKVEHFPYHDPLMNGDYTILEQKADEILRRNLDVRYGGNLMVRTDTPAGLFPKLRKSGMTVALIGVESGSATTLRFMRKRHNPDMAAAFIKELHDAGIRVELNFIVGFPTETEAHFQETLQWLRDNRPNIDAIVSAGSLCLQPSELYDQREKFNIVVNDPLRHNWCVEGGDNTLEMRLRRLGEFTALAADLGLMAPTVRSNEHNFKPVAIPNPQDFLPAFCEAAKQGAYCQEEGLLDLQSHIRRLREMGDPSLVKRALYSLRERGIKGSLRRGLEWARLHAKAATAGGDDPTT